MVTLMSSVRRFVRSAFIGKRKIQLEHKEHTGCILIRPICYDKMI